MQRLRAAALTVVLAAALAPSARAEVHVAVARGRVSVTASNATVRQILAEWARVGQVRIVNLERIPGGPVTLEIQDMPEDQALDLLLRSVAGYLAAPRPNAVASASRFDRVVIMATAAAPRRPTAAPAPAAAAPLTFTPFAGPEAVNPGDDSTEVDEGADAASGTPAPTRRGPVFNAFPRPQIVNPLQIVPMAPVEADAPEPEPEPETPAATPAPMMFPGAVAVPGMIAAPPQQAAPGGNPRR
ncbi:MAG: hypothetical protein IT176_05150 [Acidobacteria bacterium]|nr:hypothetical protein [Acidobacteriota bacterium]